MDKISIYTDGAASGNPGRGGYGVILEYKGNTKELSQGYRFTTNNRMELLAVIIGLEAIKDTGYDILIYSDSKYVVDAINKKWVFNWERTQFKKKKNIDLWKRFLKIYRKYNVKFKWVKGHAGHEKNERCDYLAVDASKKDKLEVDLGYELTNAKN
ncbi:MAG: ribonuclease HI [Flavobacteriales bacterium]|jgi:ribonuclease HI|nr:ribonuclease HI [Flavobacteriales bacterium]|tara:strand:- start:144 stop:611 length:468 start_codon:yes stop_codon:yes gene_type:complete